MAAVHSKNTSPEMAVRRLIHSMGYRYRLHVKDLPGSPDLVFPSRRKVIFVHGCFWHRHSGCRRSTKPQSNTKFWEEKFRKTVIRDHKNHQLLRQSGWLILVIWECELKNFQKTTKMIVDFLDLKSTKNEKQIRGNEG